MLNKPLTMQSAVKNWFGDDFEKLHPLLQQLHTRGGTLTGIIDLHFATGIGGFIGKRLAAKLGIPIQTGKIPFEVRISHQNHSLGWNRIFNHNESMHSQFIPHGAHPNGFWYETTGKLTLELGVEIRDGGWYWIQRGIKVAGVRLPLWLFPTTHAHKIVNQGHYEFSVAFSYPLIGRLFSYSGLLTAATD